MHEWTYREYCVAVAQRTARFGRTTAGTDVSAPVPTCPGWTVADLVRHHGTSQRRVSVVLRTRSQTPVYSRDLDVGWPADPAAVGAWYDAGRTELLEILDSTDPRLPVWTNGPLLEAGYWARRILHEAVLHGADAEVATGTPVDVPARLAADGIEEFLDAVRSQPAVVERLATLGRDGDVIDLAEVDPPGRQPLGWRIRLQRSTFDWKRTSVEDRCPTRVSGTSADLLFLVYGRPLAVRGVLGWTGDRALVDDWLAAVRW